MLEGEEKSSSEKLRDFLDLTAKKKIKGWKKGLREGTTDETFREFVIMKEMGWSWTELMKTPETVYITVSRILTLKSKEEKKLEAEAKSQMKKG